MITVMLGLRGRMLRGALVSVLSRHDDLEVVGEYEQADDLLAAARRARPAIAVVSPPLPGAADLSALCQDLPTRGVLVLLDRQAACGASLALARLSPRVGLMVTDSSLEELIGGVRRLARGEPVLDPVLAVAALNAEVSPLTVREREVLRLVMTGATAQEAARTLCLTTGTIRNHVSRILTKTGARTRIEAIRVAQDAGWI